MKEKYRLRDWQELTIGGFIVEGGNAKDYETGTWRTWRPVWKEENCIHCLTCWVFCPEDAYRLKEGFSRSGKSRQEIEEIDYYHCKGCGICVRECPVNRKGKVVALEFVKEEM